MAPVACVTSGVTSTFGVASSDKDSAPMAISEVAIVAAPIASIAPHEFVLFVPYTNIDDSTRQVSL